MDDDEHEPPSMGKQILIAVAILAPLAGAAGKWVSKAARHHIEADMQMVPYRAAVQAERELPFDKVAGAVRQPPQDQRERRGQPR